MVCAMGKISVGQRIVCRRMADVLRDIFGYDVKAVPTGYKLPENEKYIIWFIKLSKDHNGRSRFPWVDLLSSDENELVVSWGGDEFDKEDAEDGALKYINKLQIVFANRMGSVGYEFIGVFECQRGNAGSWFQVDGKRHYKRVSVEIDVKEVRSVKQSESEAIPHQCTCVCDFRSKKMCWMSLLRDVILQFPYVVILMLGLVFASCMFKVPGCWYSHSRTLLETATRATDNHFVGEECELDHCMHGVVLNVLKKGVQNVHIDQ